MSSKLFVELKKIPGCSAALWNIEWVLLVAQKLKDGRCSSRCAEIRILEINGTVLRDPFRRAEEENSVFKDRPAPREAIVESAQMQRIRHRWVQRVDGIEIFVTVKQRPDTVKSIPAALGDNIDYRPRCLSKLGLEPCR